MDFIEPIEPIPFTRALYNTLRACRPNYNANDYKWRLGSAVIGELERQYNNFYCFSINTNEKKTLYGIDVEIDYLSPYNIQLFEDITDKIAVDEKRANDG